MSEIEQDAEIGRLVREHGERRREYLTITAKLNRIGAALKIASEQLIATDADAYSGSSYAAKRAVVGIAGDVDLRTLLRIIEEHIELSNKLKHERELLKQYGIDR